MTESKGSLNITVSFGGRFFIGTEDDPERIEITLRPDPHSGNRCRVNVRAPRREIVLREKVLRKKQGRERS